MDEKRALKEALVILLASIVLALSIAFKNTTLTLVAFVSFLIIITVNVFAKKVVGYYFETNVKTRFWSMYHFGLRKASHFKGSVPMVWLPLLLSLLTKGVLWWLAILEFDVEVKPERASRRHGLYRFTEVTEWHMAWIAIWGIIANVVVAIGGYILGFELFAKLGIYYAAWSLVPFSSLDGSKIFFGNKILWILMVIITVILLLCGIRL